MFFYNIVTKRETLKRESYFEIFLVSVGNAVPFVERWDLGCACMCLVEGETVNTLNFSMEVTC